MKNVFTLLMIILFANTTLAQNNNYNNLWKEVEKFEQEGLPKSALEIVEQISEKAKKENNNNQIIKSLIYKSKYALILEDEAQLKVITDFKTLISESDFPTKNITQNLLANLYWQYYQENRYRFYNRTHTKEKVDKNDFRTWDLQTLFNEIALRYEASLQNGLMLQQEDLKKYNELLITQKDSKTFRPTLYDLLAHNALDFYKTEETTITKPAYKFEIDNPKFLGHAKAFSQLSIESKDSTSLQLKALKLYQDLVQFHLKDESPEALADVDIQRLKFIEYHAILSESQSYYINALKHTRNKYKDHKVSGLYQHELAQIYYNQSDNYEPKTNEEHRWKAKEAFELCNEVINKFPNSKGAELCEYLKQQILRETLNILTENFVPIDQASKVLVRYKNINALDFTIYHLSENELKRFNKLYDNDEKLNFIKKLKVFKNWNQELINEHDYQSHSVEVPISSLKNGRYMLFAKAKSEHTVYAYSSIQVTNFALINKSIGKNTIFQVIDRNNGKPITNANLRIRYNKNYRNATHTINRVTDENGEVIISRSDKRWTNIKVEVNKDNEVAYFGEYYINKYYKPGKSSTDYRGFLFTDRSIYRPGQTVYFKGIALKSKDSKTEVLSNQKIDVSFFDANGQLLKTKELITNDFGSVNGEFIIPSGLLNGKFRITLNADYKNLRSSTYVSVEEYKRPKFETSFNPIKESFKVNDTVNATGKAIAYAGNPITDAKVVYRVHRKVQLPRWCYWYRPSFNTEPQEITHGETTTDAKGEFTIDFKAIPDASVDKTNLPVFKYEITADVTDINGETRSSTTIVNVGYHSVIAQVNIDELLDKSNKKYALDISTKNLNGEDVNAKGTVKIYKLEAPKQVLRKRSWSAPDYKLQTKEAFKTQFPYEAYDNESDINQWKKGELVFDKTFDTGSSNKLDLGNIKKWKSGAYIIVLESKDKFGQLIKDEIRTTLFSPKDKTVADNKLFSITTDKSSYKPNDTATFTIGSSAEDMVVFVEVEKDRTITSKKVLYLKNNKKSFSVPVTENDLGGFVVHVSYAYKNTSETKKININVPYPKTDLEIETTTFRDKLQPGSEETWSFKIKGPKGDKVSAELLASMYDASLDQFKSHSWSFNPIYRSNYYSNYSINSHRSFNTKGLRTINSYRVKNINQDKAFDQFNWHGLGFGNSHIYRQQYLKTLHAKIPSSYTSKKDNEIKNGLIQGVITDESGLALPGANIIIKGTSIGTQTDFDGFFSLSAKSKDIIQVSYFGYKSIDIVISNDNYYNVTLIPDSSSLEEVVVVGYGTTTKKAYAGTARKEVTHVLEGEVAGVNVINSSGLPGSVAQIRIRGYNDSDSENAPLYVVDGVIMDDISSLNPSDILSTSVFKDKEKAIELYGSKAENGVVIITTKNNIDFSQVKARKNLQETAFFYPDLKTDEKGNVKFSFTTPEALTKWKLQLLAHTKTLESATKTLETVTQKELMVTPNAPRFLREGDQITFSSKVSNLTDNALTGQAKLELTDAITGKDISKKLIVNSDNSLPLGEMAKLERAFSVDAKGNTTVSWNLTIPNDVQAVQYKVLVSTGEFSDGEQNALPVLSNRMLVTETMPMWIRSNQTKTFTLDKLKNTTSSTLKHHNLTLEMTSNPAWYAVQALPYLMEYPYECNEQTFSRYYSNALASHIVNSNPRIKDVFDQWKNTDALMSNLEKNQELKSLLIQETPWLRDAQSETEQKKRIALLFDLNKMNKEFKKSIRKLKNNQLSDGSWPWFDGGRSNRFITQHIITGFGHLSKLGVISTERGTSDEKSHQMIEKAIKYLDAEFVKEYNNLKKYNKNVDYNQDHLSHTQLHYLYMRSFFPEVKQSKEVQEIADYYHSQIKKYWLKRSLYSKGLMALVVHRMDDDKTADKILKSLKENSITSEELGMYWKENTNSWYWYQAPIETQALMIEVFSEVGSVISTEHESATRNLNDIDNLKIWLLKNKQTNRWKTTKATTEAVYALLLQGSDWLSVIDMVDVTIGNEKIEPSKLEDVKVEAGTEYFKTSWKTEEITPEMADVTITKKGEGIAWGGLYWQYFEDLDKITSAETPLKLKKKLFLKAHTDLGEEISEITDSTQLNVGDLVRVRIELRSDRNMEFIHMKDMRASGLEPVNVLSKYKWQDGLGYYESTKDASTNFFIDYLPKGVYVFEYDLRVNNAGNMSNGITTIQSMYAPEFSSHSEGVRIKINE